MKIKLAILCNLLTVLCLSADAQGTAFTYSGQLQDHGSPANGIYDLVFALYNNSQAGSQVGLAETNYNVAVTNGLFTTTLDFGGLPFNGQLLWLDLSVRTNGATIYTGLTPRQQVTPTPYAVFANTASNVSGTIPASQLSGSLANSALPANPVFSGTITAGSFSGNGANVTSLNAANLTGQIADSHLSPNVALLSIPNSFGTFALAQKINVGVTPYTVIAADVNGDGHMDLISANQNDNTLSVVTNDGNGGFVLSQTISDGNQAYVVIAEDVNNDGHKDLISVSSQDNAVSVFTNDGSGRFTLSQTVSVGLGASSVVATDANKDGHVDLITADTFANTVSVLTNNGGGRFTLAQTVNVGSEPNSLAAADVNGDGWMDLISANANDSTVSVMTNNHSGGFVLSQTVNVGNVPDYVTVADMNGDSHVDLITANLLGGSLSVLTNNNGVFTLAQTINLGGSTRSVTAADVNSDGHMDLISVNLDDGTLSVLTNNGTGGANLAQLVKVGASPCSVAVADVNGDGRVDLISANSGDNTLSVMSGTDGHLVSLLGANQTFTGVNSFLNPDNVFAGTFNGTVSGDGSDLYNIDASELTGVLPTSVLPGFQADFETIGGGDNNNIDTGGHWSTIGGGQNNSIGSAYYGFVGGGQNNTVSNTYGVVSGGYDNTAGFLATVPGGQFNIASGQLSLAAGNQAHAVHKGAFVWADSQNAAFASTNNDSFNVRAQGGVHFVTGGAGVTVDGQPIGGSIPGLTIQQNYAGAPNVILGSPLNFVQNGVVGATIGGGGALNYGDVAYSNSVMGDFGTVGGGIQNTASGQLATIGGGQGNVGSAGYATVGGGSGNLATNYAATVPGGSFNIAGGQFSFAAGLRAHATNNGAFVWADSQGPPFSSTSNDQFLIRAQGGVGINTNNPGGAALNVNGTVTATSLQGNGAVPWQVFSGTTLQAQPNTGYLLMNNTTPMVVTLPASPNIGDIVRISTASREGWGLAQNSGQSVLISSFAETLWRGWVFTNNVGTIVPLNWTGIAVSADGIKLVAVISGTGVRNVITSADSGRSWTFSSGAPALNWTAVASSSTGQNLVGVADSDGIYISSDWGATWEESKNAPNNDWIAVASSSTGVKLVAITASGQIFASINSGVVWSEKTNFPVTGLASVASSQDGSKLVAVGGGAVYISGDSGLSWSSNALSSLPLNGVTSSSDGSKLVAVGDGGYIFTSSNAGASWSTNSMYNGVVGNWLSVASSGDGTKLIASCHDDSNPPENVVSYISDDSGITWGYQYRAEDTIEGSVASSASGNTRVSADHGSSSRIAIYQDSTSIGTSGSLSILGRETSAVELQYIGNGQFMPISHEGNFSFQ